MLFSPGSLLIPPSLSQVPLPPGPPGLSDSCESLPLQWIPAAAQSPLCRGACDTKVGSPGAVVGTECACLQGPGVLGRPWRGGTARDTRDVMTESAPLSTAHSLLCRQERLPSLQPTRRTPLLPRFTANETAVTCQARPRATGAGAQAAWPPNLALCPTRHNCGPSHEGHERSVGCTGGLNPPLSQRVVLGAHLSSANGLPQRQVAVCHGQWNGWVDERWMDGHTDGRVSGWTDGQMNRWMNGQMDG